MEFRFLDQLNQSLFIKYSLMTLLARCVHPSRVLSFTKTPHNILMEPRISFNCARDILKSISDLTRDVFLPLIHIS